MGEKKRKEQRECKKKKKEQNEKQSARRHGRSSGHGRKYGGHGKGKGKEPVNQRLNLEECTTGSDPDTGILKDLAAFDQSELSDVGADEGETSTSHISRRRRRQVPARCRSYCESDNDGIQCNICQLNEPASLSSERMFWVDCDNCGIWVHT